MFQKCPGPCFKSTSQGVISAKIYTGSFYVWVFSLASRPQWQLSPPPSLVCPWCVFPVTAKKFPYIPQVTHTAWPPWLCSCLSSCSVSSPWTALGIGPPLSKSTSQFMSKPSLAITSSKEPQPFSPFHSPVPPVVDCFQQQLWLVSLIQLPLLQCDLTKGWSLSPLPLKLSGLCHCFDQ